MKNALPLIFLLFLFSCSVKIHPQKGNYPPPPISFHSDKPFEKVWDKLVDFFTQQGLSIRVIDKSSGLIISEKKSLPFSTEDKTGKIFDPSAFIVLPRIIAPGIEKPILPYAVFGEWNVRVKPDGSGTIINVNLLDFIDHERDHEHDYRRLENDPASLYSSLRIKYGSMLDGQTTGVFENYLAQAIK